MAALGGGTSLVSLRRGSDEDRAYIVGLAASTFADLGDYDSIIRQWLDFPRAESVIALAAAAPCGFALVAPRWSIGFRRQTSAELVAIAVDDSRRGQGVGRTLLARAEQVAALWSACEVRLHTAESNSRARAFFGAAGYEVQGSAPVFYPRGQPALQLVRALV